MLVCDESRTEQNETGLVVTSTLLNDLSIGCDITQSTLQTLINFTHRLNYMKQVQGKTSRPLKSYMYKLILIDVSHLSNVETPFQILYDVYLQVHKLIEEKGL